MKSTHLHSAMLGLFMALGAAGCAGTVQARGTVHTSTTVSTPALVTITPGVWVVEDYPSPVFYSEGYYWRSRDGVWFRSYGLSDEPVRVSVSYVPIHVRRIHRPSAFVYYHAPPGTARRHIKARAHHRGHGHGHGRFD